MERWRDALIPGGRAKGRQVKGKAGQGLELERRTRILGWEEEEPVKETQMTREGQMTLKAGVRKAVCAEIQQERGHRQQGCKKATVN